jgi:RHS repeat-associated protein
MRTAKIATGEVTEYQWDHRNRLTGLTFRASAGETITKRVEYVYDVFDRRIAKKVDADNSGQFETVERYVYDGDHIALQFDGVGALTHRYLPNPQHIDQFFTDEQLDPVTGDLDHLYWALADNQETVRDLIEYDTVLDQTDLVNHRVFDSFGRLVSETDPSVDHLFSYTGREWDADARLYYYRARWYDPAAARFISEDPIGFLGGDANLGRYVCNDPLNFADPSGFIPIETVADFVGIGYDAVEFVRNPSWGNAGFLGWSVCSVFVPYMPGSYVGRVGGGVGRRVATEAAEQSGRHADDALEAGKYALTEGADTGAANVNAAEALRSKLAGLQKAQQTAARTRKLPDGRIRYYGPETPARTAGPTRGASLVTECDPKTGAVRQWMESYDHTGNVVRVHSKSINGQNVIGPHYPPTGKELRQ